jgi:phosphodiester glycosidase
VSVATQQARTRRRRRRRRWPRRLALLLAVLLVVPVCSYVRAVSRPSSVPLGVRSVEWLRANDFAWLVDTAERTYYTWKAPKPGGPTLTALPSAGGATVPVARGRPHGRAAAVVADSPPAPIAPLIQPRLPGEGVWHLTRPGRGRSPGVLVTTFRSDPVYPRIVAYVAWIDHLRTQLTLNPGRYEPPAGSPRGLMEVPPERRSALLATFNSGFTWRDGHGGFVAGGRTYEPLQSGLATLVAYRGGKVNIVSWNGGAAAGPSVLYARQNLPLIVNRGRLTPHLSAGPEWGATLGNQIRVWRSGVGVDRWGNLIYAAADYQTVTTLARILQHAGAVRAMELDINAEWPSFISYRASGGRDPVKLVPNPQQGPYRYLVPDDRDFFAVYARPGGTTGSGALGG